jgi:predicted peptidase
MSLTRIHGAIIVPDMPHIQFLPLAVVLFAMSTIGFAYCDEPLPFAAEQANSESVPATANRGYRLLTPREAKGGAAKLPLVIYLHGAGSKGDDNGKPLDEPFVKLLASAATQRKFPCFVLVPQCRAGDDAQGRPNNWVKWENQKGTQPAQWERSDREASDQLRGAMAVRDEVLALGVVDESRVYLTGVSMGGSGSWWWGAREPDRFAAVVTVCGLSDLRHAAALAKTPVWTFHGSDDPIAPVERTRRMVEALKKAGGNVKLTEFTGVGHNISGQVLTEGGLLDWLFAQRRGAEK